MSDLLLRGRVDMSEAKTALSDAAKSVKKYEQEIESAAQQTGRFQQTIGAQMKEVRRLLTYLEANGQANSQAYRDAQRELAKLTDQMGDMSKAARMMASDTVNLDIAKNSLTGLVTAMGALQSVTALTGTESESFNRVMKGLQTTLGLVTAAIVLMNLAQKEFIATMMANPYGIAITAAAALVGVMLSLGNATSEADKEAKKFHETLNKEIASAETEKLKLDGLIAIANDMNETYDKRKQAIDKINEKYPQLHANIDNETGKLKLDAKAYNDLADAIRNAAYARAYEQKLTDLATKKIEQEEKVAQARKAAEYDEAHKHDAPIVMSPEYAGQAQVTYIRQASASAENLREEEAELARIEQQILETSRKAQEYAIDSSTSATGNGNGNGNATPREYEFGSDEWLQHQDEDTVKRYWDWVYNGIMNEARNKPIKVKPIIIPEEEEEPEDPEFLKMLENYRFEKRKQEIDAEQALNESSLQNQMDYYQRLFENESLSYEERAKAYEEYLERKRELADQEAQIDQQTMQSAANMINSLGSMISSIGSTLDDAGALQARAIATVAQAIATIIQGYATASAQAAEAGPIAWAAFSVAGLAQIIGVITTIQNLTRGKFANGGIVGGTTTIGDYNLARVNKGEMILNGTQQARLFKMLNSDTTTNNKNEGTVTFRISGSDLVGTLNNYNKIHNRVR
jgi:hypothetical protein